MCIRDRGYIFPWGAPILLGWATIQSMQGQYDWLPIVTPTSVFPFVFQGWFLLLIMLVAALTSWGLTYESTPDTASRSKP